VTLSVRGTRQEISRYEGLAGLNDAPAIEPTLTAPADSVQRHNCHCPSNNQLAKLLNALGYLFAED
jgi:hypothetical protein